MVNSYKGGNRMLGKKHRAAAKITTLLGNNTEFHGDIVVQGDARIDGNVDGNVQAQGILIIGSTGRISGNITVKTAVIGGEVLGNIIAQERVELTTTAKVLGDISMKTLIVDENAVFQGNCDMNQEVPEKRCELTPAKPTRNGKKSARAALEEALKEVEEENQEEPSFDSNKTEPDLQAIQPSKNISELELSEEENLSVKLQENQQPSEDSQAETEKEEG